MPMTNLVVFIHIGFSPDQEELRKKNENKKKKTERK
jgi:hypothetical protein